MELSMAFLVEGENFDICSDKRAQIVDRKAV